MAEALAFMTMFAALIDAWSPGMLRVARAFVADEHAAQDVVQETWLGVLRGIAAFEGRSSVRTWAYRILLNRARSRGARDAQTIPAGDLTHTGDDEGPTVAPRRFRDTDDPYPGHWRSHPPAWPSPEDRVVVGEMQRQLAGARRLIGGSDDDPISVRVQEGLTESVPVRVGRGDGRDVDGGGLNKRPAMPSAVRFPRCYAVRNCGCPLGKVSMLHVTSVRIALRGSAGR